MRGWGPVVTLPCPPSSTRGGKYRSAGSVLSTLFPGSRGSRRPGSGFCQHLERQMRAISPGTAGHTCTASPGGVRRFWSKDTGGQHSGLPGGPGTLHRSGRGPELEPPLPPPVQAAATGPAPHPHGDWQSLWPCPVRRGARDSWRCLETAVVTLGVGALTGHRRRRVFKSWPWGVSGSMAAVCSAPGLGVPGSLGRQAWYP